MHLSAHFGLVHLSNPRLGSVGPYWPSWVKPGMTSPHFEPAVENAPRRFQGERVIVPSKIFSPEEHKVGQTAVQADQIVEATEMDIPYRDIADG